MGSGKTHWGEIWAAQNNLSFIDLDEVIELKEGCSIAEIFETKGEAYFREIESVSLRACADLKNAVIACGGGTPCFDGNINWMNDHGTTIYIACTIPEIMERVMAEKDKRPLLKKLNEAEVRFFIEQKLRERAPFYTMANSIVQADTLNEASLPGIISIHTIN